MAKTDDTRADESAAQDHERSHAPGFRQDGSRGGAGRRRPAGSGPGGRTGRVHDPRRRGVGLRSGCRRRGGRLRRADRGHPRAGPRGERASGRFELRRRRPDAAQRIVGLARRRRPGPAPGHAGRERPRGLHHGRSGRGPGGARRQCRDPVHGPQRLVGPRHQGPEPVPLQRAGCRTLVGRELPGDPAVPDRQLRPVRAGQRWASRRRPVARARRALLPPAGRADRYQGGDDYRGGRRRRRSRAHESVRAGADERCEPLCRIPRRQQRGGPRPAPGVLGPREGRRVHVPSAFRRAHPRAAVRGPGGGDPSPLLAAPTPRDRRAAAELLAERQCRGAPRDGRHQGPPGCHPGQRGPRGQSRGPRHVLSGPAGTGLPDQRPCLSGPAWSGWQRANGGI